jgi:hypothetical protein
MDFQNIVEQTLEAFSGFNCQKVNLPDSIAHIERNEINGVLNLENNFVTVNNLGQLRIVHIHSPKINIITLFFFPDYRWQLPVYCMESVVFGLQPIIGILDTVCLLSSMLCYDQVKKIMINAHNDCPQLQQANDMPEWMTHCCSDNNFFIRPQGIEQIADLCTLHLSVLADFAKILQRAKLFCTQDARLHRGYLQDYKDHHRINAPGLNLMNRSFGEQWTNDYMSNYLFQ